MSTLLILVCFVIVVRAIVRRSFIGRIIVELWKLFVDITKVMYYGVKFVHKGVINMNKKLSPEPKAQGKKDNVVDLKKYKISKASK